MEELFRDIPWYEWIYKVSNYWNVKSVRKNKILKPSNNKWYKQVVLHHWVWNTICIHRLVAISFLENKENKREVNHKDWDRSNNFIDNLEWVTSKENQIHKFKYLWCVSSQKWRRWILHPLSRIVLQYDLLGNIIKTWNAIMDASRELWIWCGNISNCCRWRQKTSGWFIWKFHQ